MKSQSLMNFNVPIETKDRFNQICALTRKTRTAVLVELMERYIVDQTSVLKSRGRQIERIDEMLDEIRLRTPLKGFKEFLGSKQLQTLSARQKGFKSVSAPNDVAGI